MFHLAHISDIHLSPLPVPTIKELMGKRITGYLNWKKNRKEELGTATLDALMLFLKSQKPDHLVISGDIVNLATKLEFTQAREWLSAQGAARDISLTFGNHDAYIRGALAEACKTFQPWIKGDEPTAWCNSFPYMRVRDNVAIIAASSAIATPPFQASGYFDSAQAHHLGDLLDDAADRKLFRVVMIHHPPFKGATHWHKKLWGVDRFQAVMNKHGADLILHGHTHLPTLNHISGKTGRIPVVGVSSASQAFGGRKPPANYNFFSIGGSQTKWTCELQRFTIMNSNNDISCTEKLKLL
ncbi:metallophosphoesterase family protein [Bartonella sp. LJL80]